MTSYISAVLKNIKLYRFSKKITRPRSIQEIACEIKGGKKSGNTTALEAFFDYVESEPELKQVMNRHNIDRERLKGIYSCLVQSGAGSSVNGKYVPLLILAYPLTLDYAIRGYLLEAGFDDVIMKLVYSFNNNDPSILT